MTVAPSYVAVKRKREDPPVQSLILEERRTKHARINVEYRLESVSQLSNEQPNGESGAEKSGTTIPPNDASQITSPVPKKPAGPRHFELATTGRGKRSADAAGLLPTFIERSAKRMTMSHDLSEQAPKVSTLKRPGTRRQPGASGNDTKVLGKGAEPSAGIAAALNAFALEEAAQDEAEERPKPRVIVQPRRPVRRRREPEVEMQDTVMSSDGDEDYVYDIYIRSAARDLPTDTQQPAPAPPRSRPVSAIQTSEPADPSTPRTPSLIPFDADSTAPHSVLESYAPSYADTEVGYLILPPDESSSAYFWSASPGHSPSRDNGTGTRRSSSSRDGEDEDSNAEDYYGADYPEDEVDSDDELGVGEWGRFRRNGSDDEDDFRDPGWAGRRQSGEWSDSSLEADRMINPWKKFGGRT